MVDVDPAIASLTADEAIITTTSESNIPDG